MTTANDITLKRTSNTDPDFKYLVTLLDEYLLVLNGEEQSNYAPHNKLDYLDTVIVAYYNDQPVGCGCFKKFDNDTVEIKRMFIKDDQRGKGIASRILNELELWAKETGFKFTVLETLKTNSEAVNLYKKRGYSVINNYGPYITLTNSVCMQKSL